MVNKQPKKWFLITCVLVFTICSTIFPYLLKTNHDTYTKNLIELKIKDLKSVIIQQLDLRIDALNRMSKRWERHKTGLENDIKDYLLDFPEIFAINCIDSNFQSTCFFSQSNNLPFDTAFLNPILIEAQNTNSIQASFTDLPKKKNLLAIAFPITKTDNTTNFLGNYSGALNFHSKKLT